MSGGEKPIDNVDFADAGDDRSVPIKGEKVFGIDVA